MMKRKASLSALAAMLLVLALLAGCGGGNNNAGNAPAKADNNETAGTTDSGGAAATEPDDGGLERIDLVYYAMGDPQPDEATVVDAVNEKLLEKLNATITVRYSTWTDFQQKYQTELTSGGSDFMYTASWLSYGTLARAGAFHELDDLLDEYVPTLRGIMGEGALNTMRVEGSIYALPNLWPEYVPSGVAYREDLRRKFNLPVPDSFENMEAFFLGIKENMPEQPVLRLVTEPVSLANAFESGAMLAVKYPWVSGETPYGLASNYETPSDIYDYWYSKDFIEDMKLFKKWADLGFWSRSALSDTQEAERDTYSIGLCVALVSGQNPNKTIEYMEDFARDNPDWINEFFAYGEITGSIYPAHPTQNATAFPRSTSIKNAGRALQVVEYIMTDREMNELVMCGIEGTHYKLDDGFYYPLPEDAPTFIYEGFNTWNLRVQEYMLVKPLDVRRNEIFERIDAVAAKTKFPRINIAQGFSEDFEAYQAERTAVSNVIRQYLAPIQAGFVDDVEAAIADFLQRAENAGLQKCRDNWTEQWLAYCDEFGYK